MTTEGRKRILLADDDQDVLELLEYNLITQGYKVRSVADDETVIKEVGKFSPDLVVLDIMMPHINGIEICRELRKKRGSENISVFFLTAKTESSLLQVALDNGGDDLIHKMMGLRTLIMKINAVLKEGWIIRKRMAKMNLGSLILDRRTTSVHIGNRQIVLSSNEFELLYLMAQNPTKSITEQNIHYHIWGSDIFHVAAPIEDMAERISRKLGMNWILETGKQRYGLNPGLI